MTTQLPMSINIDTYKLEKKYTMLYPTLYKKTKTGAIQTWHIEQKHDMYRMISGQLHGQMVTSTWTVAKETNIGKSNHRSSVEQAIFEIESAYKKQKNQGKYKDSIDDINEIGYFEPMLAMDFKKFPFSNEEFIYSSPKYDGSRCIASKEGLFTRKGKTYVSVPHIFEELKEYLNDDIILDGELYIENKNKSFNDVMSLVRKTRPSLQDLKESKEYISYHVYDIYIKSKPNMPFSDRLEYLKEFFKNKFEMVRFVESIKVHSSNKNLLNELYSKYLSEGFEGQMIRLDESYRNKRTWALLKRKEFLDNEFVVLDILEGDGNRSNIAGKIEYKLNNNDTFKSSIRGTYEYCKELLENKDKYIGGIGTVRYFEMTPAGKPRFPVTIFLYENERDI